MTARRATRPWPPIMQGRTASSSSRVPRSNRSGRQGRARRRYRSRSGPECAPMATKKDAEADSGTGDTGGKGRGKLVLATGVFDILHLGHLYYLMEAKKLGDRLVVVVARDDTARRVKRAPIVPEHLRVEMLKGLKPV